MLRIIGLQADPSARGRWREGTFELISNLDVDELESFFLDRYAPTPVLSPWNGRSGFYPKGNSTAVENLARIEGTGDPRFERYRELIGQTRALLESIPLREKPKGETKERLLRRLRREWPDSAVDWLDAAVVLAGRKTAFPPLLGSGGNDGSYDFSSNLMAALAEAILGRRQVSASLLKRSLEGTPAKLARTGLAYFHRDASPTNSPWGEAAIAGNPWDLILGLEGTLALAAGAVRRHATSGPGAMTAPFTVRPTGAGYGSAVAGEAGRAELWLPLWSNWANLSEVIAMAREFRAQVGEGHRLRDALSGLDLARAAGELGVAAGVSAFERYALLERAGQSTLAVTAGRVEVKPRSGPVALKGIDRWLRTALRFGAGEHCPQGPRIAIDRLQKAVYEMASRDEPATACAVLEALGEVETSVTRSGRATEALRAPLQGAPAGPWVAAADDGSHEFAIAAGIASLRDRRDPAGPLPALRDYLHGTARADNGGAKFDPARRNAVSGASPTALLAELHAHRHRDAARAGREIGRLGYDAGAWVPLDSARLLAADELDDDRILGLARGIALLSHAGDKPALHPGRRECPPQPDLDLISLAWHRPGKGDPRAQASKDAKSLGARQGWAARLSAGATRSVIADAALRLQMAGLPPRLGVDDLVLGGAAGLARGRRLSAALLAHPRPSNLGRLLRAQIAEPTDDNDQTKDGR